MSRRLARRQSALLGVACRPARSDCGSLAGVLFTFLALRIHTPDSLPLPDPLPVAAAPVVACGTSGLAYPSSTVEFLATTASGFILFYGHFFSTFRSWKPFVPRLLLSHLICFLLPLLRMCTSPKFIRLTISYVSAISTMCLSRSALSLRGSSPSTLRQKFSNGTCQEYVSRLSSCSEGSRPSKHRIGLPSRVRKTARAIRLSPEPVSAAVDYVRVPLDSCCYEEHSHIAAALCYYPDTTAPQGCDIPAVQQTCLRPPATIATTAGCTDANTTAVSIVHPQDAFGSRLGDAHGPAPSRLAHPSLHPEPRLRPLRSATQRGPRCPSLFVLAIIPLVAVNRPPFSPGPRSHPGLFLYLSASHFSPCPVLCFAQARSHTNAAFPGTGILASSGLSPLAHRIGFAHAHCIDSSLCSTIICYSHSTRRSLAFAPFAFRF